MRDFRLCVVASLLALGVSLLSIGPAEASKPRKQATEIQVQPPPPVPMHAEHGVIHSSGPCCEHKCCKKRERKCRHECAPAACPPTVEYKGCPAPCFVEKVVSVTHPKSCCTLEVVVRVPADKCERVHRDRDGDVELDYGKYEVSLNWKDGGRRLVVDYDD
jgi:hypothetical protein